MLQINKSKKLAISIFFFVTSFNVCVSYHQTKQRNMEEVIDVYIPIAIMILVFAVVYVTRRTSNKEKIIHVR